MNATSVLYEKICRKPVPPGMRGKGPLQLVWKGIRKWLCVAVIPFVPFNALRILGYRLLGFQIGRNVFIGMQCYLDDLHPQRMEIEDDVVVSYRVTFACHGPRTRDHRLILRQGSYVGTNATLLGGCLRGDVVIGPYATVGACALVNKSVPPLATVAGIPAKVIRTGRPPWEADDGRTEELCRKYLNPTDAAP
ncbi:MAG: acyltransferase [Kiritimatiellia bacterium]